jgi:hypothetical protein
MKISERFFKFPIKVYDGVSYKKLQRKKQEFQDDEISRLINGSREEEDDYDNVKSAKWLKGWARVPYSALGEIYYYDSFTFGRRPSDVKIQGFDVTTIYHRDYGEFECLWSSEEFEKEMDDFAKKCEDFYDEIQKKELEESRKYMASLEG